MNPYELITEWTKLYNVSIELISYSEQDIGLTTAGKCLFYHNPPGKAEIIINSRLGDNIGKEETTWHEFCHAWEWQEYGTHGHGDRFKELYSNRSYPWYAHIIQCIDMIVGEFVKRGRNAPLKPFIHPFKGMYLSMPTADFNPQSIC